jgi:cytochrome P450
MPSSNLFRRRDFSASAASPPTSRLPSLVQTFLFWRWPHRYLEWRQSRHGSRFTMSPVGLPPSVFFSDEADIRAILTAPADILHPGAGAAVITPLVGERSFILLEEAEHMAGRKAITPSFYQRAVADHAATVYRVVEREVASWPSDEPFAVHPHLRALTLRVILTTIFRDENALVLELHRRLLAMLSVTDSLTLQEPQLRGLPGWRKIWKQFSIESAAVDKLVLGLIHDKAAERHGVLSLLLRAINPDSTRFTTQQVRDGIMSLILAGHETTASQLAWAFQLIAHHPRVLCELLSERDRDEDTYLTATIQEAMRHRPVFVCTIPRVLQRDFEIAGTIFQPPAQLLGCIHLMHHDPRLYSNPQSFTPERFLNDPPGPHLWLPWGGGRKRCPGHHLAMFEMRAVLRAVLSKWEVVPVARSIETARWRSVIVTPGHGSRIILRTRHRSSRTRPLAGCSTIEARATTGRGTCLSAIGDDSGSPTGSHHAAPGIHKLTSPPLSVGGRVHK